MLKILARSSRFKLCRRFYADVIGQNSLGIQCLSSELHARVFGERKDPYTEEYIEKSNELLDSFNLSKDKLSEITLGTIEVPDLVGESLGEHFHYLGLEQAEPYLTICKDFIDKSVPPIPEMWSTDSGWTKYQHNVTTRVDYPTGDCLIFDVEVLAKIGHHPIIATAASTDAWFSWVSPSLNDPSHPDSLISIGPSCKVVVGHNVGYDRARIKEEFTLKATPTAFIDTMSLHSCVSGLSSQQRPEWLKRRKSELKHEARIERASALNDESFVGKSDKEDFEVLNDDTLASKKKSKKSKGKKDDYEFEFDEIETLEELDVEDWKRKTCMNSLKSAVELHLDKKIDKNDVNYFISGDKSDVIQHFQKLMTYCATDVQFTSELFTTLFPKFLV